MNFCTLFLKTENVHLMKDVGQLPLCLMKEFGYHAYVATYKNGEYPYLKCEAKGLELQFVKRSIWDRCFDGIRYIYINRKKIDVLNVYHLNLSSFLWIIFFKFVRKKGAITYLKLDANHLEMDKMQKRDPRALLKHITIRTADIVSAESTAMKEALQKYCKSEILYIPNGYAKNQPVVEDSRHKENIILTAGRLGTYEKATELLVEAFLKAGIVPEWKLVLAGAMTEEFRTWITRKLSEHPESQNRILMLGNIEDKTVLQEWYSRAKIFVLPSRVESFGIVLIEALMAECYVITSDAVLAAKDLIQNPQMGCIVTSDSEYELRKALEDAVKMDSDGKMDAGQTGNNVRNKFLWSNILIPLDKRMKGLVGNGNE